MKPDWKLNLNMIWNDLRHGVRVLAKSPGFAAAAYRATRVEPIKALQDE